VESSLRRVQLGLHRLLLGEGDEWRESLTEEGATESHRPLFEKRKRKDQEEREEIEKEENRY